MSRKLLFKSVLVVLMVASFAAGARAQGVEAPAAAAGGEIPALKIVAVEDKLAPAGWQRYQVGEPFVFSAIFPKLPDAESARVSGSDGSLIVRSFLAPSATAVYGVIYSTDLPGAVETKTEEQKKKSFNDFIHGFADGVMGIKPGEVNTLFKITAERQARVGGHDGYEKEFTLGTHQGRVQMVFIGPDRVAVLALWPPSTPVKERTDFFSAFTLPPRR